MMQFTVQVRPCSFHYLHVCKPLIALLNSNNCSVKAKFRNVYMALKRASIGNRFQVLKSHSPNPFWSAVRKRLCLRYSPMVALADDGFAFDEAYDGYVKHYNLKENKIGNESGQLGSSDPLLLIIIQHLEISTRFGF